MNEYRVITNGHDFHIQRYFRYNWFWKLFFLRDGWYTLTTGSDPFFNAWGGRGSPVRFGTREMAQKVIDGWVAEEAKERLPWKEATQ